MADRGLAEDAAQEAFFVAFRDISKLKNASHFGRWLAKISRNIASDMAKARRRDKLIPIEDRDYVSNDKDEKDNVDAVTTNSIKGAFYLKNSNGVDVNLKSLSQIIEDETR